jgi:hypothetical protein
MKIPEAVFSSAGAGKITTLSAIGLILIPIFFNIKCLTIYPYLS